MRRCHRPPCHAAHAGGESGWDVFSLRYDVRGPLATIFTRDAMGQVRLAGWLGAAAGMTSLVVGAVWALPASAHLYV